MRGGWIRDVPAYVPNFSETSHPTATLLVGERWSVSVVGGGSLDDAVRHAVESTAALLDQLEAEVDALLGAADRAAPGLADLAALRQEVEDALARHRRDAETFRIVLFGRTGAGKSSLIEALVGGDGKSISDGRSDYTTSPRPVDWGPLELIDTPGFRGNPQDRARLEQIAGDAVARADLVLLCFDTLNQLESEFEVVRREIVRYRRPCAAVLNVKNPRWREGGAESSGASTEVGGHARHLRGELDALGMPGVPITAINSKHAVAARASDDYKGHDAPLIRGRRERIGVAQLETLSNLGRLEQLLASCLREDAPRLRAQAVRQDVLALVREGCSAMQSRAQQTRADLAQAGEVVTQGLGIIGAGTRGEKAPQRGRWSRSHVTGGTELSSLQDRCPDFFPAMPRDGKLQRTASELLSIHLAPHRMHLHDSAEEAARQVLAAGGSMAGEELLAKLEPAARAAELAAESALDILQDEFADALSGMSLSLAHARAVQAAENIDGHVSTGNAKRWAMTELGLAGTAAVALLASNPIGWAVAAGATLFGWFSGRRRRQAAKEAEARAAKVRGTAIALVRKAADELYIGVRDDYWRAVHQSATHVAGELLSGRSDLLCASVDDLTNLTAASSILSECRPNPEAEDSSAILQAAVARLRDGTRPDLTGAELLLGLDGSTSPPDARPLEDMDPLCDELTRRSRAWVASMPEQASTAEDCALEVRVGVLGAPRVGVSALCNGLAAILSPELASVADLGAIGSGAERCDLLLWLLRPNATLEGLVAFEDLLGAEFRVREAVLARSVFCITRLDQVGPDLTREPTAVVGAMRHKAREVSDLLSQRLIDVDEGAVLFACPDPFGAPAQGELLAVSGLEPLVELISRTPGSCRAARESHQLRQKLELGLRAAQDKRAEVERRLASINDGLVVVHRVLNDVERFLDDREMRLRTALGDRVDVLALDVCNATGRDAFNRAMTRLVAWPDDPQIKERSESWARSFHEGLERVLEESSEALTEILERWALPGVSADAPGMGPSITGGMQAGELAAILGRLGASRDNWYAFTKFVSRGKFKFKPYGAIKGAARAGQAAKVFAALGVALTALEQLLDAQQSRKRREKQEAILGQARGWVDVTVNRYVRGSDVDDDSGESKPLFTIVTEQLERVRDDRVSLEAERDECASALDRCIQQEAAALADLEKENTCT